MVDFKELKTIIKKACVVDKTNLDSRLSFSVDVDKLESFLRKENLHVMAFADQLVSFIPDPSDLQLIGEYIYRKEIINGVMDGYSQIVTFIIYNDDSLTTEEQINENYQLLNNNGLENGIDVKLASKIVSENPIYRVLVVRRFNNKEDKFDYNIYFRSNRTMINYINSLKEEGTFENSTGVVDVVEEKTEAPATEEVEAPANTEAVEEESTETSEELKPVE